MKKALNKYGAVALALMMGLLFDSCSKNMAVLSTNSKMETSQELSKVKIAQNTESIVKTNTIAENCAPPAEGKTISAPDYSVSKAGLKDKLAQVTKIKNNFAQKIHEKAGKVADHQLANISNIAKSKNLSSYKVADKTSSWLGAAVIFLIIGLVLLFLGFGSLGSLFWAIGIVLLVVGIIFFILWLLAASV